MAGTLESVAQGARPNRPQKQTTSGSKSTAKTPGTSGNPAKRNGPARRGPAAVKPATAVDWVSGARLRTLPLAIAPVFLGTGAAIVATGAGEFHGVRALLALVVAVCLQIGVNYANDYSDGIRGTDNNRVGPARLTGSGAAAPRTVLIVALAFFGAAAIAGLLLVIATQQWWLLLVGTLAIAAAWLYTGGKRPYGYLGLGELFVFVFFGLVATLGTTYVQAGTVNLESWLSAISIGFIACAVLMVNNLRDIVPDRASGKRTLAVLIGGTWGRVVFCVFLLAPFLAVGFLSLFYPLAFFTFFVLLLALPACLITVTGRSAGELILALKLTSFAGLGYGVLLGLAFAL